MCVRETAGPERPKGGRGEHQGEYEYALHYDELVVAPEFVNHFGEPRAVKRGPWTEGIIIGFSLV